MKTVTFYSYKGGSGRSLALLTFAWVLSKIGKNVCLLDFDFEAPGLHYKCEINEKVKRGFIDYLSSCIKKLDEKRDIKNPKVKSIVRSIHKYSKIVKEASHRQGKGWIKLIPAGDIESSNYFPYVNDKLPEVFRFTVDKEAESDVIQAANNRLFLFDEIKKAIQDTIKPDYLLIDSRSGILERVGVCTRLWADDVVFLTLPNRESLVGTRALLWGLKAIGRVPHHSKKKPIKFVTALARILPKEDYQYSQKNLEVIKKVHDYLTEPCNENSAATFELYTLNTLPEDLLLLLDEKKTLDWVEFLQDRPLFRDYLKLFKEVVLPNDKEGLRQIHAKVTKAGRVFQRDPTTGALINPADMATNVAFRVDTFSNLLVQLATTLKNEEERHNEPSAKAKQIADESLKAAGSSCGSNFANRLLEQWHSEARHLDTKEKIEEWCLFDSYVGFGIFKSHFNKGKPLLGRINLTHSFL